MANDWYWKVMGAEAGPFTDAKLLSMARAGQIAPDDLLKMGANGQWIQAESVSGLLSDIVAKTSDYVESSPAALPNGSDAATGATIPHWLWMLIALGACIPLVLMIVAAGSRNRPAPIGQVVATDDSMGDSASPKKLESPTLHAPAQVVGKNPTMGELHSLLVPAGYLVGKYSDNMAWKKDDEAFYFEVVGAGNGQIEREIAVLALFKGDRKIWSSKHVKVDAGRILVLDDHHMWMQVFGGKTARPSSVAPVPTHVVAFEDGDLFYDPDRNPPYLANATSRHQTRKDAIAALASQFGRPTIWVEMKMGPSNKVSEIHHNLAKALLAAQEARPPSTATNSTKSGGQIQWVLVEKTRIAWQEGKLRTADRARQAAALAIIVAAVEKAVPNLPDREATLDYIQVNVDSW